MTRPRLTLIPLLTAVALLASSSAASATQIDGSLRWGGGTQCAIRGIVGSGAGLVSAYGSIACNWNMGHTRVYIMVNTTPASGDLGTRIADSCSAGCEPGNSSASTQGTYYAGPNRAVPVRITYTGQIWSSSLGAKDVLVPAGCVPRSSVSDLTPEMFGYFVCDMYLTVVT